MIPIDQDEDYSPQRSTSGGWADTFSSFSGRSGGGGHSGVRWTQPESSQKVQEREREEYEKRVRELGELRKSILNFRCLSYPNQNGKYRKRSDKRSRRSARGPRQEKLLLLRMLGLLR